MSAAALGRHLGVTAPYVAQLASDGSIVRLPDGKYDQDACRLAYLNWLRDPARRSAKSESAAELQRAKAREIELRTAERAGKLVELEDAYATMDYIIGIVRTELEGLAARVTRDLEVRRKIEDEVRGVLGRASDALLSEANVREA